MQLKKKLPREKKKLVIQPLSYGDFGIIPVTDFDYSNYKNVRMMCRRFQFFQRTGAGTVEPGSHPTSQKALGDLGRFAQSTTSTGAKNIPWI
jgi:hypothetical protein